MKNLNLYGEKNSFNYQNLTNLAETTLSQAKEMSVPKDTERTKWYVVNSRYCQECDRPVLVPLYL
ncbi:MAG: hypothetical protein RID53_20550 [Coleofasciculus sp. B1-GNL1-01]|uniref:hypothetical protein n=1 Tax=Coleofasciculus sp. B1-GNL1-01 TaxID=3068484 RepID=UPI003301D4F9